MSKGDWLKDHRKQVITHTSIIVVFILFTGFVAEPLFDSLERIPGEAQLQRLELPDVTTNIVYGFHEFTVQPNSTIWADGWAFISGQDAHDTDIYIILRSESETYAFDTVTRSLPHITEYFKTLGLDLDDSGFYANIPLAKIRDGSYSVGIYITKSEVDALQYTDWVLMKSGGSVTLQSSA